MENIFALIGLGNPGKKYENTRHNVGFDTIDLLAAQYGINVAKIKHKALVGEGIIQGERVILAKPQTFMNASGESVREIIEWYKMPLSNVILIYDDVDLQPGSIRIRAQGSAGTHNGMKSVLYHVQSENFPRIRIGIGRPPEGWDMADFVLSRFSDEERKIINESISKAADAAVVIMKAGANTAMNKFNS